MTITLPSGQMRYGSTGNAYLRAPEVVAERLGIPTQFVTANDVLIIVNFLGTDGWELVAYQRTSDSTTETETFVLKRPAP